MRDLQRFWDIGSLARKLTPAALGLRYVSVREEEALPKQRSKKELREEIWSLIEAAGLGDQFTRKDVANFLSEGERSRVEFLSRKNTGEAFTPSSYTEPELVGRLNAIASQARSKLRTYPSSVDKTLAFFEAATENEVSPEALILLYEIVKVRKRATKLLELLGRPGSPALGAEAFDNIARFRFLDLYGPQLGRDWLDDIIEFFRQSVNQIESSTWIDEVKFIIPSPYVAGETLWLISRSPNLVCRLLPEIRRNLDLLLETQTAKGTWLDRDRRLEQTRPSPQWQQDPASTAMCAVAMLKLGDERHTEKAMRAATCLARTQDKLGFWKAYYLGDKPSILITVVALEAIRRAGFSGADDTLRRGEHWIITQQDPIGLWIEEGVNAEFLSVAVCEYFRDARVFHPIPPGPLRTARGFLRRAQELAAQSGPDAARLAVIAAFHGLEMFLYGVAREDRFSFDIFCKNGDTVGLRSALALLRGKLHELTELKPGADLRYATQIKQLAAIRDQVVHKGADVAQETAAQHVGTAAQFVEHYSHTLLELRLLS